MRFANSLFRSLPLAALAAALATPAVQARDLTVVSWGGTYQDAQREIYFKPFTAETGTPLLEESWDGGYGVIAAKMAGGSSDWDVVQVESEELILGCADGMYEEVDWDSFGGTADYLPAAVHDCGVGTIVWSTGLSYDADRLKTAPTGWADFWDVEKIPGKRSLRRGPKYTLEIALMADGVPVEEVYQLLATPEGVDRAFAKLDQLKPQIVWWEAGAQPFQFLGSGEVAMTTAYNGRLTGVNRTEGRNFRFVWPGSIYAVDSWVVMKGSPNKDAAWDLVRYTVAPEHQSQMPAHVAYGSTNLKSNDLTPPEFAKELPTDPANMVGALAINAEFWVDHIEELSERFNAWLAQ